jgi:hypothetical protein
MSCRGPVVAFLSSGRCGTQWLTAALRELHGDEVEVEHEPVGPLYNPRRHFRRWDRPDAILEAPVVARHLERIARSDHYVETGWPIFGAVPLLAARFPDRLRLVHVTRHPVPSALSHLAHSSYAGSPRDDDYTRMGTLGPSDPNVFHPQYAQRWDRLSPYERCLFWWTEVHLFALEAEARLRDVPFLRVKAEAMLAADEGTLSRLSTHLELPDDGRLAARTDCLVDRWHHRTDLDVDFLQIEDHPATARLAKRLGYSIDDVDADALSARYAGQPDAGLDRIGRSFS